MSLLGRVFIGFANVSSKLTPHCSPTSTSFHSVASIVQKSLGIPNKQEAGTLFIVSSRSIIRYHFPRPSERKRIKKHGFKKLMSTPEGRRVLMNRILKAGWVLKYFRKVVYVFFSKVGEEKGPSRK